MSSVEKALETQLQNIQKKTGKSFEELEALVRESGLTKHGQIRDMLKSDLGLGHGDANTLTHMVLKSDGESAAKEQGLSTDDVLDEIYSGPKAHLRPIHDKLMASINQFGDFEIAPKKNYVSLRRKKQFAMIGPATKTRVEVGLNAKGLASHERLLEQAPGGMCNYKVNVVEEGEVDEQLIAWVEQAYHSAG